MQLLLAAHAICHHAQNCALLEGAFQNGGDDCILDTACVGHDVQAGISACLSCQPLQVLQEHLPLGTA